jgi:hypothetical protein
MCKHGADDCSIAAGYEQGALRLYDIENMSLVLEFQHVRDFIVLT